MLNFFYNIVYDVLIADCAVACDLTTGMATGRFWIVMTSKLAGFFEILSIPWEF